MDGINQIDISPGKSLLISSGNDGCACVFDVKSKRCIKKLTFRDKECMDSRGKEDSTNFMIKGCCFTPDGAGVYILASKTRYKSFVIKFNIKLMNNSFDFIPSMVTEVHN